MSANRYLIGLCWLVQRVQYPLMARVGADEFPFFEAGHVGRIGPVVAPMMLLELGTGLALWWTGGELPQAPLRSEASSIGDFVDRQSDRHPLFSPA